MRDILLSKETRYMKDYDFTNLKQNMHFDIENRSPYIQMTEALNNSRMNGDYENTIGENKEESISQAIDIALREMRSAEQSMREQIYRPEVNKKRNMVSSAYDSRYGCVDNIFKAVNILCSV